MELSPEQRTHWENQLVNAEKAVEVARRMLGHDAINLVSLEQANIAGSIVEDE